MVGLVEDPVSVSNVCLNSTHYTFERFIISVCVRLKRGTRSKLSAGSTPNTYWQAKTLAANSFTPFLNTPPSVLLRDMRIKAKIHISVVIAAASFLTGPFRQQRILTSKTRYIDGSARVNFIRGIKSVPINLLRNREIDQRG